MMNSQVDYSRDFVAFFRDLYVVEGAYGPAPIIPPFLETWLRAAFPLPSGDPAARNVLDARTKKEGKSALAGAVALYMATRSRDAEIIIAASDIDQAKDRVLRAVKYAVEHGPLAGHAKVYRDIIELDNGSFIQAIPADWKGAAGGNPSAVIFDELHVWTFESQRRLFDELIIPPTIKAGVRWCASYAGWTGESVLLEELWNRSLTGKKISDLPIYHDEAASLLAFVDTGPESWRMPWMTDEYIEQTRTTERPNTYRRLWLNEWVSGEGEFLPTGSWDACFDRDLRPVRPDERIPLILGIDAATSNDHAGIVGTIYNEETQTVDVKFVREWIPKRGFLRGGRPTIDLTATVGAEVNRLRAAGQIDAIVCDPFQLHTLLVEWEQRGIRVIELPQTSGRVESDTSLFNGVVARSIRHYGDKDLTQHVNNSQAIEGPRGMRIAKRTASQKIDLAICLSMSHWGALNARRSSGRVEVIPLDLTDESDQSAQKIGDTWYETTEWNESPHPPGVTWHNCHHRNKGCVACVQEQIDDGSLEALREAEGPYLENAGQFNQDREYNPLLDSEAGQNLIAKYKAAQEAAGNEQEIIRNFYKSLRMR